MIVKIIDNGIERLATEEEIAYLNSTRLEFEQEQQSRQDNFVRQERDKKLIESDWTQVIDAPVDQAAWATYRQTLRDIPSQAGFPNEVTWPTEPEV